MVIRKALSSLICLVLVQVNLSVSFSETAAAAGGKPPDIQSDAAILMDQKSGKVLYGKNITKRGYPASLTKILTAVLVLENLDANEEVVVGNEIDGIEQDASMAGLSKGDRVTAHDLVWALMLPSGSDAAYSAAVAVARKKAGNPAMKAEESIKYFSDLMNEQARKFGAVDSHFVNPDGYPDPDHYSTVQDLALISKEARKNGFFKEVASTYAHMRGKESKSQSVIRDKDNELVWFNKNLLLNSKSKYFYKYADGIKTGYTLRAGYCLASSAVKEDLDLISVILKADSEETRFLESQALFEYGFSNFRYRTVLAKDNVIASITAVRKYFGDSMNVNVLTDTDYTGLLSEEEFARIEKSFEWDKAILLPGTGDTPQVRLQGPVNRGQKLGRVQYLLDGKVLAESNLLASNDALKGDFADNLVKALDAILKYKYILLGALLLLIAVPIAIKRIKKA